MGRLKSRNAKLRYEEFFSLVVDFTRMYGSQQAGYACAEGYWYRNTGKRFCASYAAYRIKKTWFSGKWPDVKFYVVRILNKKFDAIVETSSDLQMLKEKYNKYKGVRIFETDDGFLNDSSQVVFANIDGQDFFDTHE